MLSDRLLRFFPGAITHVKTSASAVALTFDDGPHPKYTARLLDILAEHSAHATFFMLGEFAKRHRGIVEQVALAGHSICNHSWNHVSFPSVTGKARRTQIRKCEEAIAPFGLKLFRPPYADLTVRSSYDILFLKYQVVTYSIDSQDWREQDPYSIAERVRSQIKPGSIVLFHDTLATFTDEKLADREGSLLAVRFLLDQIGSQFEFVTVPELIKMGKPQVRNWRKVTPQAFLDRLESTLEKAP